MRTAYSLAWHFILASTVITSIAFLTSCTPAPRPQPPPAPQPVVREPPRPPEPLPPPPFERYPGEAANVQKVLDTIPKVLDTTPKIQLIYAPKTRITFRPPSPQQIGYPAYLTIRNETQCEMGFYLGGPVSRAIGVKAGNSETLEIVAGSYLFGVDPHCGGRYPYDVPPMLGREDYAAGGTYTLTIEMPPPPKMGSFVVDNATGADLTVQVDGVTHTVAPGSSTIRLRVGSYTAIVTARCGTKNVALNIIEGPAYTGKYSCQILYR